MNAKSFFRFVALAALAIFIFQSAPAQASLGERTGDPKFSVRAPAKLAQGVINLVFGWSAFIIEPVKAARDKDDKFMDGVCRGFVYPISYTFLGAWDILTFWVPGPGQLGTDMSKVRTNVFGL